MRKYLIAGLLLAFLLTGCGKQAAPNQAGTTPKDTKYKVAYILNGTSTEIFKMAFNAAIREGKYYGIAVDVYTSNLDDLKFQDIVHQCAQRGYDGMFISHGKAQYSYGLIKPLVDKGIKVVTFDTVIADAQGNGIEGVTQVFQNDQKMAQMTLDYICDVLYPNKRPVRVLKLWRGPGIAPFDRRQEIYKKFEDAGKIKTLELLGPSNPADAEGSMVNVTASVLPKYPKGTVDVIWSTYDVYGRGAYKALKEAGRTDIPVVSIDISNQDINIMREKDSVWKACVAVHFENVGIAGIRLLAQKIHGDKTPKEYILSPSLVTAQQLTPDANVENLGTIIKDYGVFNELLTDWMIEARKTAGAK